MPSLGEGLCCCLFFTHSFELLNNKGYVKQKKDRRVRSYPSENKRKEQREEGSAEPSTNRKGVATQEGGCRTFYEQEGVLGLKVYTDVNLP